MDLRCPGRKFAELVDPGSGVLEVKCDRRSCGASAGAVVLHRFDLGTGELTSTIRYRQPPKD